MWINVPPSPRKVPGIQSVLIKQPVEVHEPGVAGVKAMMGDVAGEAPGDRL